MLVAANTEVLATKDQADMLERFVKSLSSSEMDLVGFKALATTIALDLYASKALSDDKPRR